MGKKILLADDSVTIQKVVELTFMDEDYEVTAVGNGDEALARLDEGPDVVIADVHMPGASGYEVCRQAIARRPGLPVLLLVGTFEPFDEVEARACGAQGHLKKPFDSQELLRRVEELLAAAPETEEAAAEAPATGEGVGVGAAWDEMEDHKPSWEAMRAGEDEGYGFETVEEATAAEEEEGSLELPPAEELELEPSPWTAAEEESGPAEVEHTASTIRAEAITLPAAGEEAPEVSPAEEDEGAEPAAPAAAPAAGGSELGGGLSDADVDRIARRVVELLGDSALREVAWEVVPDLAEVVIKERIRELERQVEG